MSSVGEQYIIESIMSLTSYSDKPIIQALIDYKLNGMSGLKAAKKHGLPHRNTVYRADAQYRKFESRILDIIPMMGGVILLARERGGAVDPLPVAMDEQGEWSFTGCSKAYEKADLEFFVKVRNRLVQL